MICRSRKETHRNSRARILFHFRLNAMICWNCCRASKYNYCGGTQRICSKVSLHSPVLFSPLFQSVAHILYQLKLKQKKIIKAVYQYLVPDFVLKIFLRSTRELTVPCCFVISFCNCHRRRTRKEMVRRPSKRLINFTTYIWQRS